MEMHPTLEGMSRILTLSYNHLPHELKSCMMYLSIFPEDYPIRKDRLLHRWIAEGLVAEKRGLTMLEVAESYFDELLSRNMIFSVHGEQTGPFEYDGKMECCQVHDMLLEVMVSKSLDCNFVSLLGGQYNGMSYDRIRRLSIHEGVDNRTNIHISGGNGDSPCKKRTAPAYRTPLAPTCPEGVSRMKALREVEGAALSDVKAAQESWISTSPCYDGRASRKTSSRRLPIL
jgi:hypothetical protein